MADERDTPDDASQDQDNPKRPPPSERGHTSRLSPQPGGFVLEPNRAPPHEHQQPAPEARQPYASLADAAAPRIQDHETRQLPPDTPPLDQDEGKPWSAAVEAEIAFWFKAQARYKAALEQASGLNAPDTLLEVCAQSR